jgi:hypothetical protein
MWKSDRDGLKFNSQARGIVFKKRKLLLARLKDADISFMTRGNINLAEKADPAVHGISKKRKKSSGYLYARRLSRYTILKAQLGSPRQTWIPTRTHRPANGEPDEKRKISDPGI